MKPIAILLFLATVALFAGCESTVELSQVDREDAQTAVQSTEEPVQTNPNSATPEMKDVAKEGMAMEDAATGNSPEIEFGDQFPEVLAVKVSRGQGDKWRFNVTLSSSYDTPQRYADAWRVLDDEDNELGVRILGHDHANEQPFTRSGTFEIPGGIAIVFVEGRDQANGWSGQRFEVKMP